MRKREAAEKPKSMRGFNVKGVTVAYYQEFYFSNFSSFKFKYGVKMLLEADRTTVVPTQLQCAENAESDDCS